MITIAVLICLLALLLLWIASRKEKASGLPGGRMIYADIQKWGVVSEPFYNPELNITGKPDYLVDGRDQVIPVEVKSSAVSHSPYDSHIYQLAAYCLLVQRQLGQRPRYGILHYTARSPARGDKSNLTYMVDYTPTLESAVLDVILEMRSQNHSKGVDRSHNSAIRCQRCGYRSICDQKL